MKTLMTLMLATVCLAGAAVPAFANCGTSPVCGNAPFTKAVQYMSTAGYLRWQQYLTSGNWLGARQTVALTKQTLTACSTPTHQE